MTRVFAIKGIVSNLLVRSRSNAQRKLKPFKFVPVTVRSLHTCNQYSSRKKDEEYEEIPRVPQPSDRPIERTVRILKHDIRSIWDKNQAPLLEFPSHVDILIVGGGIIGSAIAYFIRERIPRKALTVMVLEKDPSYAQSATSMSIGGLRKQFALKENIEMAQFGAEFLRNVPRLLSCEGETPPDIQYHPYGCLQLANEEQASDLQESWLLQKELGCHVELLTKDRIKQKFPWMNTDGVDVGLYGTEGEGWFDAWALHFGMKRKAVFHGTVYTQAEIVGFEFEDSDMVVAGMDHGGGHQIPKRAIVQTPSGELKPIHFAYCVIAAGHESARIAEHCRIGRMDGILSVPLPVEARKRNVYCIQASNGPGIDCPFVIDTNGAYFRREGYAGNFVAGQAPPLGKEPHIGSLDVDYDYFESTLFPSIAHRVPGFNPLKLNSAWAGFYDYNTFDQSGIIGPHPYFPNIYFCCGFSGYGIQQAPAAARAIMELILDGEFRTLDLIKYHFERFLVGKEIKEKHVN